MKYNIPVILGTSRKGNHSQKVAQYIMKQMEGHKEIASQLLDLGKADLPIMEERLGTWKNAPDLLLDWVEILKGAHGVIIVAPEYKNGYPGSLKNFLDFLPAGIFRYKPIGISTVSSGVYGGINCLSQLRLVCLSMAGLPIPDRFLVSDVVHAFDETGGFKQARTVQTAEKFLLEMIRYTKTLSLM